MNCGKFILLISTVFFFSAAVYGSFEAKGHGVVFVGAGSCGAASSNTDFAVFLNPAKIYYNSQPQINLFYRNFYGIKNLDQISLGSCFKLFKIPFGAGISRYGNKLYSETELRLGSACQLFDFITLGLSVNWYALEIKNYGGAQSWGFDLAGLYKINSRFAAGFVVSNLNEPEIGAAKDKIPLNFTLAFSYQPLAEIEINMDLVKDNKFDFDYRFGIHYHIFQWVTIMTGYRELVNSFAAGFNLKKNKISLAYSIEYHPDLGSSNSLGFGYEI
jgi:hypothetical protein